MAGRELESVERAVKRYLNGETVKAAAEAEGISTATLNRGLNRRGVVKRGPLNGEKHWSWQGGLKAQKEAERRARAEARKLAKQIADSVSNIEARKKKAALELAPPQDPVELEKMRARVRKWAGVA